MLEGATGVPTVGCPGPFADVTSAGSEGRVYSISPNTTGRSKRGRSIYRYSLSDFADSSYEKRRCQQNIANAIEERRSSYSVYPLNLAESQLVEPVDGRYILAFLLLHDLQDDTSIL